MIKGSIDIAEEISKKSPVAVQTTKVSLVYARDHSVDDGLNQIVSYLRFYYEFLMILFQATWNQMMLQSEDFATAVTAQATKSKDAVFSKL